MANVLVVYASRHGGTAGIAARIADVLRRDGAHVELADAADRPDPDGFDAYVIGSGVQIGKWHQEGFEFLERNESLLAKRPVWLFSSGPLPGSTKEAAGTDPLTNALGPATGPGSGGRRKVEEVSAAIHPRDHRVFQGAFDPKDPPKSMSERMVRMMPAAKRILPTGDFREWDVIEAWAREIASALPATVAAR